VRFKSFVVLSKSIVFLDAMLFSLVDRCLSFEDETARSSKMLVLIYQTAQCIIPENSDRTLDSLGAHSSVIC
jgi:hypothetical protein